MPFDPDKGLEVNLENVVMVMDRTAFWGGAIYMRDQCFKSIYLNNEQMQVLIEIPIAELYEKYLKDRKKK